MTSPEGTNLLNQTCAQSANELYGAFVAPGITNTQDGSTPDIKLQRFEPEAALRELGGQATAAAGGTRRPFGVDLMERIDKTELGRKITGSLPTNKLTQVWNPNSKRYVRLSDGSDPSSDD